MLSRKTFSLVQESPSVPSTLKIVTNGHASKRGHRPGHVDSNDACRYIANPEEKWIMVRPMLVGAVRIVFRPNAAKLEENTPAYRVIRRPVALCRKGAELWRLRGQVSRGDAFASARITSM